MRLQEKVEFFENCHVGPRTALASFLVCWQWDSKVLTTPWGKKARAILRQKLEPWHEYDGQQKVLVVERETEPILSKPFYPVCFAIFRLFLCFLSRQFLSVHLLPSSQVPVLFLASEPQRLSLDLPVHSSNEHHVCILYRRDRNLPDKKGKAFSSHVCLGISVPSHRNPCCSLHTGEVWSLP